MLTNLRSALTIRAQGAEEHELRAAEQDVAALAREGRRVAWAWHVQSAVQGTTAALAGMLVVVLGGVRVIDGDMTLGALLSFFGVLAIVRGQVTSALTWVPQSLVGRDALAHLERLLVHRRRRALPRARAGSPSRAASRSTASTFGYDAGEPVLRDAAPRRSSRGSASR